MHCDVAQWQDIRHRIREEGIPKRQVSRETGIGRRTINKMLACEHPPGYAPRPPRFPKLGSFIPTIDRLVADGASLRRWPI
jgi:hypothetical protein